MNRNLYGKPKREIADVLRQYDINPTSQRIEIAHFIMQKCQHLSADEVLNALNQDYDQVSQATVYNNLRLFVERGLIREMVLGADRVYYDNNLSTHHHFLDTETGELIDIKADSFALPDMGFEAEIENVSLLIRGKRRSGKA